LQAVPATETKRTKRGAVRFPIQGTCAPDPARQAEGPASGRPRPRAGGLAPATPESQKPRSGAGSDGSGEGFRLPHCEEVEAPAGFEPENDGFAVRCLTNLAKAPCFCNQLRSG